MIIKNPNDGLDDNKYNKLGFIQITGRANYQYFSQKLNPERLGTWQHSRNRILTWLKEWLR
jgi:predicted chitinase